MADTPPAWQAPDFPELLREQLEGEHFVFNPHTGHTHVLNEMGMLLLESLADRTLTAEQLAIHLRFDEAETELSELRKLLDHQLEQLQLLGLVEPRP